jgi:enhancing lycopene biosynthesis protein 2
MIKIGVILSGCGIYDGAEIHEAVLTLLSLDLAGAKAVCLAPDIEQYHVIDHLTGEVMAGETRNVLVEAARLNRGNVTDLKQIDSLSAYS